MSLQQGEPHRTHITNETFSCSNIKSYPSSMCRDSPPAGGSQHPRWDHSSPSCPACSCHALTQTRPAGDLQGPLRATVDHLSVILVRCYLLVQGRRRSQLAVEPSRPRYPGERGRWGLDHPHQTSRGQRLCRSRGAVQLCRLLHIQE